MSDGEERAAPRHVGAHEQISEPPWAAFDDYGDRDILSTLQAGLTVEVISTRRLDFVTCFPDERVAAVIERNVIGYDCLPVLERQQENIIGLFHVDRFFGGETADGLVAHHYSPLTEEDQIGTDASILDFILEADQRPCQLVVCEEHVVGLVTLSDLQRLPVRIVLFGITAALEMTMSAAIRKAWPSTDDWMDCLSDGRRRRIEEEIQRSRDGDGFVDALLSTQFCDKAEIVLRSFPIRDSRASFRTKARRIQSLRNNLVHANEYAASRQQGQNVCAIARDVLSLRDEIAQWV